MKFVNSLIVPVALSMFGSSALADQSHPSISSDPSPVPIPYPNVLHASPQNQQTSHQNTEAKGRFQYLASIRPHRLPGETTQHLQLRLIAYIKAVQAAAPGPKNQFIADDKTKAELNNQILNTLHDTTKGPSAADRSAAAADALYRQ
jgi:hypothetical protein